MLILRSFLWNISPIFEFVEVAGFKFGLPVEACLTKTESLTSLTLPRLISLEYICAIDGAEKAVPLENRIVRASATLYFIEIFGSNDDSFFIDSYLAATLKSKASWILFSISRNKALLVLDLDKLIPPPRKKRSAVFTNFPSLSNSALLTSS